MLGRLRHTIENLVVTSPALGNLPLRLHRLLFRKNISILMYHGVVRTPLDVPDWCFVPEQNFLFQMDYLHRNFRVVSLTQAVEDLRANRVNEPTAVITFDDGYQNVYDIAYPILSHFGLNATIFLNTAFVNTSNTVWFCILNQAISETVHQTLSWKGKLYDLSSTTSKARASAELQSALKQLPHDDLLHQLAEIRRTLEIHSPMGVPMNSNFRMLDKHSIAEMLESGLVEFGAHTATHTILTHVDEVRAKHEIASSIRETEMLTGKPCKLFAYPNGKPVDYNEATISFLMALGIDVAVTTRTGPSTASTPPLELRRYGVGANLSILPFILRVHHLLEDR